MANLTGTPKKLGWTWNSLHVEAPLLELCLPSSLERWMRYIHSELKCPDLVLPRVSTIGKESQADVAVHSSVAPTWNYCRRATDRHVAHFVLQIAPTGWTVDSASASLAWPLPTVPTRTYYY